MDQGVLADGDRALLEPLVNRHIQQHDDDPGRSLASLSSVEWIRGALSRIADPQLQASLVHVSSARRDDDPYRTVGGATLGAPSALGTRFRVLRPHARGGLGEVFVARDTELNRDVALKEIQDCYADDPRSRARFLLEAEITGGLEHPGIVPVYGLGVDGVGRPYYAMRFIKGDSLKDAIGRFHKDPSARGDAGARMLELQKLLRRFLDVCNAAAYAHSRGVLHRDLKPGNIMVGQYGETLVVDWGLAKVVGTTESAGEATLRPPSASGSSETLPGSARRLGRWARRHRTGVAAMIAAVAVAAVCFAAATALLAAANERERTQAALARRNGETAQANFRLAYDGVERYFTQVSEDRLLNVPGLQPVRRQLLDAARDFYEKFVAKRQDDPSIRAELGRGYLRLARVAFETDATAKAIELAGRGLAILQPLRAARPADRAIQKDVAAGLASLGGMHGSRRELDRAEGELRESIQLWESLAHARPDDLDALHNLSQTRAELGHLYSEHDRTAEARTMLATARATAGDLVKARPGDADDREALQRAEGYLGEFFSRVGELPAAGSSLRAALSAQILADTDLDSLRGRDDFRRLLAGLFDRLFPPDPFAP